MSTRGGYANNVLKNLMSKYRGKYCMELQWNDTSDTDFDLCWCMLCSIKHP